MLKPWATENFRVNSVLHKRSKIAPSDSKSMTTNSNGFLEGNQQKDTSVNHSKLTGPFPYLAPLAIKSSLESMTQKLCAMERESISYIASLENSFEKQLKEEADALEVARRENHQRLVQALKDAGFMVSQ